MCARVAVNRDEIAADLEQRRRDYAELLAMREDVRARAKTASPEALATLAHAEEKLDTAIARAAADIDNFRVALAAVDAAVEKSAGSAHNLPDMTKVQLQRRGHSVAEARARKSNNPVALAIVASHWKTLTAYAQKRLGVDQTTLSRYLSGSLDCPPEVADRVKSDFGLGDAVWPKPPRRAVKS